MSADEHGFGEEDTDALRQTAEAENRRVQRDRLLDRIFTEDANLLKRLAE
jgi:hypothetical protein